MPKMVWLELVCMPCVFSRVYTVYINVCVESVNGGVQAESYLLFHVGFDFPPRGEEGHILYHYWDGLLHCQCGEKDEWQNERWKKRGVLGGQLDLSIYLHIYLYIYLFW